MKIRRALLSVYDKKNIASFARALSGLGVEILSTGGTAELLRKEGIEVKDVSAVTQFPEMLGGRVKTLHPHVHAAILALRQNEKHLQALAEHNIKPIDLVAVNLYPFTETVRRRPAEAEILEMIDIGGPAMLRSAAKNFTSVLPVCDPSDYEGVLNELKSSLWVGEETRRRLAAKAFRMISVYDEAVADYLEGTQDANGLFPRTLIPHFLKQRDLRYGENPHQKGALYAEQGSSGGIVSAAQLHGKELSFNNILDLDIALEMVEAFAEPACAIVKHVSPCGFATAKDARLAFRNAFRCDPLSAFGSIIGFNAGVDRNTAEEILKSGFVECIVARRFDAKALLLLKTKKNLRLLTSGPAASAKERDYKKVRGGLLVQERDARDVPPADWRLVTKRAPSPSDLRDLEFAFKVCRFVRSNAIVVAKKGAAVGIGMGQPSRVDSCLTALQKAGKRAKGAVLASDGFFPKPDSIALAKKFGIRAIVQPGGSIQDGAVIKTCDRHGISMLFAGVRHFRH